MTSIHSVWLPQMKPYPQNGSVLILDNCAIHKSAALHEVIEAQGKPLPPTPNLIMIPHITGSMLIFLPPYSPDLNLIEESFSASTQIIIDN